MKIAELFVALGFKVDGADKLDNIDKGLNQAAAGASAAVEGVSALQSVLTQLGEIAGNIKKGLAELADKGARALHRQLIETSKSGQGLKETNKQVGQGAKETAFSIAKATAAVTALSTAFLVLMNNALKTAIALKNFSIQTGQSTSELQKWQHAAEVNDVAATELTQSILGIQKASADIALGQGNIAPWQLLGISPHSNPFEVLDQLKEKLKKMPPEIARTIASEMGITDSMFQMLLSDLSKLDDKFIITKKETANLIELNRAWKDLLFTVSAMKDKIAAVLAVPLAWFVNVLRTAVSALATVYHWLNDTVVVGQLFRFTLGALAVALGVFIGLVVLGIASLVTMTGTTILMAAAGQGLAVVFGVMSGAAGILGGAIGLLSTAFAALDIAAAPLMLIILGIAAAIGIVVVAVEDFITWIKGGDSLAGKQWELYGKGWRMLASVVKQVWSEIVSTISTAITTIKGLLPSWLLNLFSGKTDASIKLPKSNLEDMASFAATPPSSSQSNNIRQENTVTVHVDGSDSPAETGRAVGKSVKQSIIDAAYQIPLPSY